MGLTREEWLQVLTPKLRRMLLSRALQQHKAEEDDSLSHALITICVWPDGTKFARLHDAVCELEEDGYTVTRVTKTSIYCGKERVPW